MSHLQVAVDKGEAACRKLRDAGLESEATVVHAIIQVAARVRAELARGEHKKNTKTQVTFYPTVGKYVTRKVVMNEDQESLDSEKHPAVAKEQLDKAVYDAVYRAVCLHTIDKDDQAAVLEELAEAMVEGAEAKGDREQAALELTVKTTNELERKFPGTVAEIVLNDVIDNMRNASRGTMHMDHSTSSTSSSTVMFYQAALLVQVKDALITPAMKESVDQLIRYLSLMAEERARFESQEHDDHSNPMLFDVDVSTSSVLDQDRLTKQNAALGARMPRAWKMSRLSRSGMRSSKHNSGPWRQRVRLGGKAARAHYNRCTPNAEFESDSC